MKNNGKKTGLSEKRGFSLTDKLFNLVVFIFACANLFPLYWMYTASVKHSNDVPVMPPHWIPQNPTLGNYARLLGNGSGFQWAINSILIAGLTTIGVLLVSALAAYSFAKLRFPGRKWLFLAYISTLMLPKEVFIVPLFKVVNYLGLNQSLTGIILPNIALPFGVYLLKQFYETIPDSLRESARIDGAGELRTFISICLPISRPGLGALTILMFVQTWNDFLWQLIMCTTDSLRTLQIGIATMQVAEAIDYGLNYAGAGLCVLPMLIIFLVFQKYFTRGITVGAVKE